MCGTTSRTSTLNAHIQKNILSNFDPYNVKQTSSTSLRKVESSISEEELKEVKALAQMQSNHGSHPCPLSDNSPATNLSTNPES